MPWPHQLMMRVFGDIVQAKRDLEAKMANIEQQSLTSG